MKLSTVFSLAAVAAAAAATSSPAAAGGGALPPGPALAAFQSVCATPLSDFAAVKKAADAGGWAEGAAKGETTMPSVTISDQMTRGARLGNQSLVMSAWQGLHKTGAKVSDCTVHADKVAFGAMRDAAAAWLTLQPKTNEPKKVIYEFTDSAGGHHAVAPSERDAAAAAGGLEILTISPDGDGAVLDLLVIKK
jgi:hypothetical protein